MLSCLLIKENVLIFLNLHWTKYTYPAEVPCLDLRTKKCYQFMLKLQ